MVFRFEQVINSDEPGYQAAASDARTRTTFHVIPESVADPRLFPQAALILSASSLIVPESPYPSGSTSSF
ncbi:hypothetical protein GCM10011533_04980 [Streptosporangium jomthongense]|nr:hypothetical protein GCM10011533_04980 [Streptosporangium jomthongense]